MAPKEQVQFELTGIEEMQQTFDELDKALQRRIIRAALKKGAAIARRSITSRVHAQGLVDTSALINNIHVTKARKKKRRHYVAVQTGTRPMMGIKDTDKYYYPAALELGTKNSPPFAFMREGFAAAEPMVKQVVKAEVKKGIIDAVRKAFKKRQTKQRRLVRKAIKGKI